MLSEHIIIFRFRYFGTQLCNIFLPYSCICTKRASVENRLLCRYASRSSLLYSGFLYIMELPYPAVYLLGARVSISPTVVPRLYSKL